MSILRSLTIMPVLLGVNCLHWERLVIFFFVNTAAPACPPGTTCTLLEAREGEGNCCPMACYMGWCCGSLLGVLAYVSALRRRTQTLHKCFPDGILKDWRLGKLAAAWQCRQWCWSLWDEFDGWNHNV